MIKAEDVFNPKDFESIRLLVYFQNTTTGTKVDDPSKCSLTEIGDKTLVLDLPARSCAKQHNVMVDIYKADKSAASKSVELLKVTGKVFTTDETDDDRARVTVECMQFDEESWIKLTELFSSRQTEIENFFKAVRGY